MDGVVSIGTTATNHHRTRGSASDDLLCHASVLSHTPRTTSRHARKVPLPKSVHPRGVPTS